MDTIFHKTIPAVSLIDFLSSAKAVTHFNSSTGRRYMVVGIEGDELHFQRLDSKQEMKWKMNLRKVYEAYEKLDDFKTINFKPFVPITHSPARGLLIHLGLLA